MKKVNRTIDFCHSAKGASQSRPVILLKVSKDSPFVDLGLTFAVQSFMDRSIESRLRRILATGYRILG
jgi:hypothetical protein